MPHPAEHSASEILDGLTSLEALSVVLGELRHVRADLKSVRASNEVLAQEVDKLRRRIHDPLSEELSKEEAADALGVSARTIQEYARRFRQGDPSGLEGFYRSGRGGKVWYTTRACIDAFKRKNRL